MSMSQLPSPDEEWDRTVASIKPWQIPIIAAIVFIVLPVTILLFAVWVKLTGKQ